VDQTESMESWGVFNPVGHTLITLADAESLEKAASQLLACGFTDQDMRRYAPHEMVQQVDDQLPGVGVLADFGQELNLMKAHRALALRGCSFLLVHAPDDTTQAKVDKVVQSVKVVTAQRYSRFIIEELAEQEPREVLAQEAEKVATSNEKNV